MIKDLINAHALLISDSQSVGVYIMRALQPQTRNPPSPRKRVFAMRSSNLPFAIGYSPSAICYPLFFKRHLRRHPPAHLRIKIGYADGDGVSDVTALLFKECRNRFDRAV